MYLVVGVGAAPQFLHCLKQAVLAYFPLPLKTALFKLAVI